MSEVDDPHASIASDDPGEQDSVDAAPGEGTPWPIGAYAQLGLETVPGWTPPPAYVRESTADASPRGADTLLPDWRSGATHSSYRRESTIGSDDRVRIRETTSYPWRPICQLTIHSRFGDEFVGTGWLIGPRTIVTAGHCVYLPAIGGWAERVVVSAARNGLDRPFSSVVATKFYSVRGWTVDGKREHDYAVIKLGEDAALPEVGQLGYAVCDTPTLRGSYLNLAGYPADKDGGTTLWWSARRSAKVDAHVMRYDADTAAGQSGAPVWRLDPSSGRRVVVGIHTNGALTGNSATRISARVFANLATWCS
ncbi:trypsin-like serine peptidase [Enhygromyxa salina]|uniref:Serine protease n=1 Tax=Enhygromyxa salina TaxID=215803 RepID=A0A2S9YRC6_9BACT|nr:trypsin-like peptidase domain-containing protein [Enhygromyxa salina]PRQ07612.1 Glutamyl endopeptidase precursor [Enhygromyxa salina]